MKKKVFMCLFRGWDFATKKRNQSESAVFVFMIVIRIPSDNFFLFSVLRHFIDLHFVKTAFCLLAILSTWHFALLPNCHVVILATWILYNLSFHQNGLKSTCCFINLTFHQNCISLTCQFIKMANCQFAFSSNWYFVN